MLRIFIISAALCFANAYDSNDYGRYSYSYFPSQNLIQTTNYFNHGIYYGEAKFKTQASFTDASSIADDQLHSGNDLFYMFNFNEGIYKMIKLVLSANADSQGYVTKYRLQSSIDGQFFFDILGGEIFNGLKNNTDSVTYYFPKTVYAKQLRFIPNEYFGLLNFKIDLYYDDDEVITPFQDKNKIMARIVTLKGENNQNQSTGSAIPEGYEIYKQDKFNNVNYYSSKSTAGQRNSQQPNLSNYEQVFGISPYEAVGGKDKLREILVYFFDNLLVPDPILGPFFRGIRAAEHKSLVLDFFTAMLGGGKDVYKGKDMTAAHTGMAILASEYDRFMKLILEAFTDFNSPAEILQEVAKRLEFYRSEVVGK